MSDPRHPASDGGYHEIPDVADDAAQAVEDAQAAGSDVEVQPHADLDYSEADIPDLAEETAEIARMITE